MGAFYSYGELRIGQGRENARLYLIDNPALAQEIAGGIAGSRLEIIADCGHLSTLERPEPVNQALRAWLSG
jgi:pimeloyl-ACP methyl ester carboxylesterase